jgi:hypothetical protein
MAVTSTERELPEEARRQRAAQRAAVLTDVGLFAQRPNATLLRELEAPLVRLRDEQERRAAAEGAPAEARRLRRRAYELAYLHAELLERTGRAAEAERLRQATALQALEAPPAGPR